MFKLFSKLKQAIIVLAVTLASAVAVACRILSHTVTK